MTYVSQVHLFLRQEPSQEGVEREMSRLRRKQLRDGKATNNWARIEKDINALLDRWQRLELEKKWELAASGE